MTRCAVICVMALAVGCGGGEEPASKPSGEKVEAPTLGADEAEPKKDAEAQPKKPEKVTIFGVHKGEKGDPYVKCSGTAWLDGPMGLRADLRMPAGGTTLQIGVSGKTLKKATFAGVSAEAKEGRAIVDLPMKAAIGGMGIEWPKKDIQRSFPIELAFEAEEGTHKGYVTCARAAIYGLLHKVKEGPLLWPGEEAGSHKGERRSIAVDSMSGWRFAGPNVKLQHVDLIGFLDVEKREVGKCKYINPKTKETKTIPKWKADLVGEVYERRSGKRIGRKSFKSGPVKCEPWIKQSTSSLGSGADWDAADAWVVGFVKGGEVPAGWTVPKRKDWLSSLRRKYAVSKKKPAKTKAKAPAGPAKAGSVELASFLDLGKLKYGDPPEKIQEALGAPEKERPGGTLSFLQYGFELSTSFHSKKQKIVSVQARHPKGTEKLKAAGVAPQLQALLGKKKPAVLQALGTPAEQDDSGVMRWHVMQEGKKAALVEVECRDIWKGTCKVAKVQYFYP